MSFLDEIRRLRQQAHEEAVKTLDVPGYGGRLAVRYRPGDRDDAGISAALSAWQSDESLSKSDELQFLIDCHEEVLKREDPTSDDDPTPYDDTGKALRFDAADERWQEILGSQPQSAREVVAALFMYDDHPIAGTGHVGALMPMLQGLERELAARVEGKPSGGPSSDDS